MGTTTHTKKGELMLLRDGEPIFTARVSRTVKGAIDVLRMSGIVEHPSPRQALALARKAGISKADFDTVCPVVDELIDPRLAYEALR